MLIVRNGDLNKHFAFNLEYILYRKETAGKVDRLQDDQNCRRQLVKKIQTYLKYDALFLAAQDSSIGDIVSQSLRQTFDFRALQSCGRQCD